MQNIRPNQAAVAAKVIDGEAIIMNLTNGAYYSMLGTGAAIWAMIDQGVAVGRMPELLTRSFEVTAEQAREDLARLIRQLLDEGLVLPGEAVPASGIAPPPAERLAYQAPELNKYTEMADLLALDPPMPTIGQVPAAESRAG